MASAFRGAIEFFDRLGVYDVVLPFLLTFTIVFAIFEKTKILGAEKDGMPRKNLNAMAAFVIALLVVASTQLVSIINASLGKIALLLIISISFLMLIGSFFSAKEETILEKGPWRTAAMLLMAFGVLSIFAYELGWLAPAWDYVVGSWDSTAVGSIILVVLLVAFVGYVTGGKESSGEAKNK